MAIEYKDRIAPNIHGAGVLGQTSKGTGDLETFDLDTNSSHIEYESDEVTALCPVTGQPDQYTVKITILRSRLGVESKSLKLYLQAYRQVGAFCEALAAKIARDVCNATGAHTEVLVVQKPRGGVTIKAHAHAGTR